MLKDSTAVLIDQYNQSGDHISVANLFLQGWKNRLITTEDVDTLLKSSSSLSHLGLHDDSLNILNTLRKSAIGKTSADIDKAVAEIEKKESHWYDGSAAVGCKMEHNSNLDGNILAQIISQRLNRPSLI